MGGVKMASLGIVWNQAKARVPRQQGPFELFLKYVKVI